MSEQKSHWITRIVPVLAFAAGIIIASIGGIMTISSSLKLALFDSEPYSYITEEECRYDYGKPATFSDVERGTEYASVSSTTHPGTGYYERTPGEIKECLEKRTAQEKKQFENRHKQNIIDGVSSLIVGGILLFAFRRREQNTK